MILGILTRLERGNLASLVEAGQKLRYEFRRRRDFIMFIAWAHSQFIDEHPDRIFFLRS